MNSGESSPQETPGRVGEYWALARRIAYLGTLGVDRLEFLRRVSTDLISFSNCSSLDIWMTDVEHDYHWRMDRGAIDHPLFELSGQTDSVVVQPESADRMGHRLQAFMNRLLAHDSASPPRRGYFLSTDEPSHRRVIEAASPDPELRAAFDRLTDLSLLILPVEENKAVVGLLLLTVDPKHPIGEQEACWFEPVSETLGRAIINRRAQFRLRERIKELTCLHGISQIGHRIGESLEAGLQAMVNLLPAAMQFPPIADATLSLDDHTFSTSRVAGSLHELSAEVRVVGKPRGILKVSYHKDHPEFAVGPFLREERDLLQSVAHEIALFVERSESATARAVMAEQLRHADRLATIGQLAAGVAHELNEPLGNILGFAQLLQKHPNLSEQAHQDAEQIVQASLHGREIVKKLLLFARQSVAERVKMDLSSHIRSSLYFLEARCRQDRIDLRLELSDRLPPIHAVASEMTQVLVNLAVNAIQSMPNGGVLTIRTLQEADAVLLIVEDTGVGMSEESQRRLFTPFYTTKDIGEGTGLGLSVVLGIVSAHGGTIHVESAPSCGSRFEIRLPAVTAAESPAK